MEHGVQAAACVLVLVAIVAAEAHRLNAWVAHFEPLWYEPLRVQRHHVRLRRSLLQQRKQHNPIFLRFFAFDKNFILKIRPDSSIFHEDFTLETETLGNLKPELGHIYSGQLVGDPSSRVFGALHGGVFEGSIRTRQGIFYVERSRKLFGGRRPVPSFHSLMYSPDDVKVPARDNLLNGSHLCGLAGNVRSWMDAMLGGMDSQESSDEQRGDAAAATRRRLLSVRPGWPESEQQRGDNDTTRARGGGRERRVCNLEVNVDHLLHAHFLDDARGEGSRARERITALVAQHVARASDVFRAVDFGGVEDVSFTVQRIRHDAPPGRSCYGPCAPCGEDGNYIMFPSPTQGRKPNNGKFSHCSRESIGRILAPMVAGESPRENCLQGECDYRHDVFSYDINVAVAFLIAHHMLSQVNATCVD
ncbi:disintegrin and metalloproteinase domain-containing protein 10 homolog [Dermacentor silvarum]|uniref:disintegrin and metalloproteinase domain-containing protein 10 homolog n=1 Tax=Dermacentor silvarum TaxID=543639 RepID=UPI002100D2FF|nr:disintegrin and metalloproteinase domain-containing protein 10 homolog [Dermacentor silvarum]